MTSQGSSPKFVLFLAVIPRYRKECISILRQSLSTDLALFTSDSHLDSSVKTGIASEYYNRLRMLRLMRNRFFLQVPIPFRVLTAQAAIVDLNPRSLTAWIILFARRTFHRRTLVWGHIHPQAGPQSRSAFLRRAMRRVASGTVSYTYSDRDKAIGDIPSQPVWVAPNSLYLRETLERRPAKQVRRNILYVGRFEEAKKVDLLVHAFALYSERNVEACLVLVGGGREEQNLRILVERLGLQKRVLFEGWEDDPMKLSDLYNTAFCSVSSGFAGLGLTQSLGFGVPMIVADKEPHSPEIELAEQGHVRWFESGSASSLADQFEVTWNEKDLLPNLQAIEFIKAHYSAEAMADGLERALRGVDL